MFDGLNPQIIISKMKIPVIYLDTNILIELCKHEKGNCTDKHKDDIGKLYEKLVNLMQSKKILCPLGNQLVEIGLTKNRNDTKLFLTRFTNSKFYLPDQIYNAQLDLGYYAYRNKDPQILLQANDIFENENCSLQQSDLFGLLKESWVIAQQEKAKKREIAITLNNFKKSDILSKEFTIQYGRELLADYQVLQHIRDKIKRVPEIILDYFDYLIPICMRVESNNPSEFIFDEKSCVNYLDFLASSYQGKLPYIHTRAILYTHTLQRPNKIVSSDKLDILWASAYLPFIDYAVTDEKFCKLINDSGLADEYQAKVYNFSTIESLLDELSK